MQNQEKVIRGFIPTSLGVRGRLALTAAFFLLLVSASGTVLADNPGDDNPIVPPARRSLFPDQHGLIASPLNPRTGATTTTYTDWARSSNAIRLQLQEDLNGLQGTIQARAAAGHILSQQQEQVAVARFTGNQPMNSIQVDVLTPDGRVDTDATASFPAWSTSKDFPSPNVDSFGIASGEMTPLQDDNGAGHDEVVVCYPVRESGAGIYALYRMWVTVLDYTGVANGEVLQTSAISSHTMDDPQHGQTTGYNYRRMAHTNGSDTFVACAAADLDGDGVDEVVLAYLTGAYEELWVEVFRYTNNGTGPPTLEPVGTPLGFFALENPAISDPVGATQFAGTIAVSTGDFNADGRMEIGIASVGMDFTSRDLLGYYPAIFVLSSDSAFNLRLESTFVTDEVGYLNVEGFSDSTGSFACTGSSSTRSACEYMRAAMVSGLFKYDPDPTIGFDFNRRQLAAVFNMPFAQGGGLRALALSVSNDLQKITQIGQTVTIPQQSCGSSGFCPSSPRFSVGAGGYVGSEDISNPLWSLAIANWEATRDGSAGSQATGQFRLTWLKSLPPGSEGGFTIAQDAPQFGGLLMSGPSNARLPLAAWDREGNSVWLGSPVHLVVYDLIKPEYIIQEPPKHTYWWPPEATDPAGGQIMDLSRKYGFYVELADEQNRDYSFTHEDQTDWTIGGSVAVTGKASVTGGVSAGILGSAKATASLSVKGQVGYDYNENKDEYESGYRSQTTTFSGQTNADDLLITDLTRMDIWRFPVSGIEVEDGLNAFWEIAFPGDTVTARGGGLNFDWYNPPHENGNILSYPPLTGSTYRPADCCADFTFVGDSGEVTEAEPFLDPTLLAWDGTSGTIALDFSETTGQGSTKSYTHSLKESLDIQVGYKTEASFLGNKTSAETTVDTNVNNENSWAEVDTESASTSNSTGFKLVKQVGNTNQSYYFMPQFYLADSGTTKVSYAVDPLGTGATFWPSTYGRLPDPALNLPRRFSPTTPTDNDQIVWVVNPEDDAKRMRGFFVRYNTLDEVGEYPLVAGAVTDGEQVRIVADVYNYSLGQGFGGLDVAFQAVRYNPVTNSEIGDPVPLGCGAGSITSLALDPRARKPAVCVWDTTGFGPAVPGAIQYYRIYVTLDPDNRIEEIYDGTIGPGQNNQGWGLVAVSSDLDTYRTPVPTAAVPDGADVSLTHDALELLVDGQLSSGPAHVVREQLTPLRVCVDTDQTQTGCHHVLIWNGDPENGGTLVADKMLPGIDRSGDSCVWLPAFRLDHAGAQSLFAQVLETGSDALPANAGDTLEVEVDDIPRIPVQQAEGSATHVGAVDNDGDLRISGTFAYRGELDLSVAQLVVNSVLNETQGRGELVPGVRAQTGQDLVLYAIHGSRHQATFATPADVSPRVRASLKADRGKLRFDLKIQDAGILEPESCGTETDLTTRVVVLDADHAPVDLSISEPWRCVWDRRGQVRKLTLHGRHHFSGRHGLTAPHSQAPGSPSRR